jgi:hypothetical protein
VTSCFWLWRYANVKALKPFRFETNMFQKQRKCNKCIIYSYYTFMLITSFWLGEKAWIKYKIYCRPQKHNNGLHCMTTVNILIGYRFCMGKYNDWVFSVRPRQKTRLSYFPIQSLYTCNLFMIYFQFHTETYNYFISNIFFYRFCQLQE